MSRGAWKILGVVVVLGIAVLVVGILYGARVGAAVGLLGGLAGAGAAWRRQCPQRAARAPLRDYTAEGAAEGERASGTLSAAQESMDDIVRQATQPAHDLVDRERAADRMRRLFGAPDDRPGT